MTYQTINPVDLLAYRQEFPEATQLIPAWAYKDAVTDYFHSEKHRSISVLPWEKTHSKIWIRPGEVSLWAGNNGSGKSLVLGQNSLGWISKNEPVVIASMEMKPEVTLARMCRQACGGNIPSKDFIDKFHDWLTDRLWLYNQQNSVKHQTMLALARYCGGVLSAGKKIKIRHLVIDSLMKCGIGVDDYNSQKGFVDDLCSIGKVTGTHTHLVAHMRKGDTEFKEGDKMDIKGTSEISDLVDNVFIFWRNKPKEDEMAKPTPNEKFTKEPDAILACRKQRNGEYEGKIALWFDRASMQYTGDSRARPIDFLRTHSEVAA